MHIPKVAFTPLYGATNDRFKNRSAPISVSSVSVDENGGILLMTEPEDYTVRFFSPHSRTRNEDEAATCSFSGGTILLKPGHALEIDIPKEGTLHVSLNWEGQGL